MRRGPPRDAKEVAAFRDAVIDAAKGRCRAGSRIADVDFDAGRRCTGWATQAHHIQPRGMGGHGWNDPVNGLACCFWCHEWIERNRALAYEMEGLLRKHGSPDFSPDARDEARDSRPMSTTSEASGTTGELSPDPF